MQNSLGTLSEVTRVLILKLDIFSVYFLNYLGKP